MAAIYCKGWDFYRELDKTTTKPIIKSAYKYDTADAITIDHLTYKDESTEPAKVWGSLYNEDDYWTEKETLSDFYYEGETTRKWGKGTRTVLGEKTITAIKAGTYPEFTNLIFDSNNYNATDAFYKNIYIEKKDDSILVFGDTRDYFDYDTNKMYLLTSYTKEAFKDGVLPNNILVTMQAGGGAGGNYQGSDSGGAGGSGAMAICRIDLTKHSTVRFQVSKGGIREEVTKGHKGGDAFDATILYLMDLTPPESIPHLEPMITLTGGKGGYGGMGENNGKGGQGGEVIKHTTILAHATETESEFYKNLGFAIITSEKGDNGGDARANGIPEPYIPAVITQETITGSNVYTLNKLIIGGTKGGSINAGNVGTNGGGGGAPSYFANGGDCGYTENGANNKAPGNGQLGSGGGGGTDENAYSTADIQGWGGNGGNGFIRIYY